MKAHPLRGNSGAFVFPCALGNTRKQLRIQLRVSDSDVADVLQQTVKMLNNIYININIINI